MKTDYLAGWDSQAENRKAEFMKYLYDTSGRTNGLLTGLWAEWCEENEGNGEKARDRYFGLK